MTTTVTTASCGPYTLTAQTTAPVTFQSESAEGILVTLDGEEVDPADYTFDRDDDGTGEITFDEAVTGEVMILSAPLFKQTADFARQGPFFPDFINAPLDRIARGLIYLNDALARAIKFPAGESSLSLSDADSRAGGFLAFDTEGNAIVASGTGADSALRIDLATSSGGSLVGWIRAATGAVLRSISDKLAERVDPKDFGALGIGTDDTAAIVAAAATGKRLRFSAGIYGVTSMPTFTASIEGEDGVIIRALAALPVMCTLNGGASGYVSAKLKIADIVFDGNNLADVCVRPIAMKASTFERVTFRGARRDGIRPLASTDNNNAIAFRNCVFSENGTIINAGTSFTSGIALVSSAARCSASGASVTISGAVPSAFGIELNKTAIQVTGHTPSIITAVAGQVLTVDPPLSSAPANTTFAIFNGSGMYIDRGSDNNIWTLESCTLFVNATAGLHDVSLYGAQGRTSAYEGNGVYGKIIGGATGIITFSSASDGEYNELNGAGREWVRNADYYTIRNPVPSGNETIRVTAGIVSFDGAVTAESSKAVDNPIDYVMMEVTLDTVYYVKTLIVTQGLAGADLSVIIPNAPLNASLPETFTIHMADTSYKTLVVKTTSAGAKVNSVAGTTGYPFAGSNRMLTFRWDAKTGGWSVTASGNDESTAAPSSGTWAIGRRVYNTAPTAGGFVGWVMTSGGWKTFGAISA